MVIVEIVKVYTIPVSANGSKKTERLSAEAETRIRSSVMPCLLPGRIPLGVHNAW